MGELGWELLGSPWVAGEREGQEILQPGLCWELFPATAGMCLCSLAVALGTPGLTWQELGLCGSACEELVPSSLEINGINLRFDLRNSAELGSLV